MTEFEVCNVEYGWRVDDSTVAINIRGEDVLFKMPADSGGTRYNQKALNIDDEIYYLVDHLKSGDVLYDIGAHVGTYTVAIATLRPDVTVVSFEPHAVARRRVEESLCANGTDAIVRSYGMSDRNDIGYCKASPNNAMAAVKKDPHRKDRETMFEVPLRTLDSVVYDEGLPFPNVMKVDIEGHEIGLFKNSPEVLSKKDLRHVNIEVHPSILESQGLDPSEMCALLEENGLHTFSAQNDKERMDGTPFILSAWKEEGAKAVDKYMPFATRNTKKPP